MSQAIPQSLSRRGFITVAVAGAAAGLAHPLLTRTARAVQPPDTQILAQRTTFFAWKVVVETTQSQRVRVAVASGYGGNSTLISCGERAVLIDCKNAPFGVSLRREALAHLNKTRTGVTLAAVVNTHHHADHTGGNHAFTSFSPQIEVTAHEKCTDRILAQMNRYVSQAKEAVSQLNGTPPPNEADDAARADAKEYYMNIEKLRDLAFVPKVTFEKSRSLTFEAGADPLNLVHRANCHTDNDITVFCPQANVMVMGDLLFHRLHPFIDRDSGANTRNWRTSLNAIIAECNKDTVIIPGHGDVTDISALEEQIAYFDRIEDAVRKAIKEKKTRKQIASLNVKHPHELGNERFNASALQAMYDELVPPAK